MQQAAGYWNLGDLKIGSRGYRSRFAKKMQDRFYNFVLTDEPHAMVVIRTFRKKTGVAGHHFPNYDMLSAMGTPSQAKTPRREERNAGNSHRSCEMLNPGVDTDQQLTSGEYSARLTHGCASGKIYPG
jgi:hypothetical protein